VSSRAVRTQFPRRGPHSRNGFPTWRRSGIPPETVTSPPTSLATPAIRRCGGAAETANMSGRLRSRTEVAEVPADGAPTAHWAHPSQGTHFLNGSHRSPRNGIPAATKQPLQPAPVTVPNAEFGGNAPTADTSGQPPSATEPMAVPAVLYAETDQARNRANVADRRTTWLVLRGGTPPGVRPSIGIRAPTGRHFPRPLSSSRRGMASDEE
jgi:hypothetical protein